MKKALMFFFAVVIGLSFAFTGFAQENAATSGPAKQGKQLTKGRMTQKKKDPGKTTGAPVGKKPAQAEKATTPATPAKVQATSATPAKVGTQPAGPAKEPKKLTKGKFTQTKKTKKTTGAPVGE